MSLRWQIMYILYEPNMMKDVFKTMWYAWHQHWHENQVLPCMQHVLNTSSLSGTNTTIWGRTKYMFIKHQCQTWDPRFPLLSQNFHSSMWCEIPCKMQYIKKKHLITYIHINSSARLFNKIIRYKVIMLKKIDWRKHMITNMHQVCWTLTSKTQHE